MAYLNSEHHQDWKTNGYLKIPGFFSIEEVNDLQIWVSEISSWEPTPDKWMHHYESTPAGPRLSRSENFVPYHIGMKATVTRGKVLDVVSELMEEPSVLYKEKINYQVPRRRWLRGTSGRTRLRVYQLPYHLPDFSGFSNPPKAVVSTSRRVGTPKDSSHWMKRGALPLKRLQRWSGSLSQQIQEIFFSSVLTSHTRVRATVQINRDVLSI